MPLKKPASKGLSMKEQLKQLQPGVPHAEKDEDKPEEGEEEVKEEDQAVEPDESEKHSKGAGGKFNRLLKAGKVPQQIKEIWQNCETRVCMQQLSHDSQMTVYKRICNNSQITPK